MNQSEKGIFINGKKQILDMLQVMDRKEKEKLLGNIRLKNPGVAKELSEKSFSFQDLFKLNQPFLSKVLQSVNPVILGLALFDINEDLQRTALRAIPRESAQRAFEILTQNLASKKSECIKARQKIINIAISYSRKNNIIL